MPLHGELIILSIVAIGVPTIVCVSLYAREGMCYDSWPTCYGSTPRYQSRAILNSTIYVNGTEEVCGTDGNFPWAYKCNNVPFVNRYHAIYSIGKVLCKPFHVEYPAKNQITLYIDKFDQCYLINDEQRGNAVLLVFWMMVFGIATILALCNICYIKCCRDVDDFYNQLYRIYPIVIPPVEDSWYRRKTAVVAMNIDDYYP